MLAVLGGEPVRRSGWPDWPSPTSEPMSELAAILTSGRWSVRGWYRGELSREERFAAAFARFNRSPHCVPTTSGTAALTLALEALDIGFGDEVIVPAYTWVATAIAVVNVNAVPVLVDVDRETGCIDVDAVAAAISDRTRAVIPVHLHGSVCDIAALRAVVSERGIAIIEDCAQAHGARIDNQFVGTLGHIGAFSLNQEKVLACGEGGALLTADEEMFDRLERLRADSSRLRVERSYGGPSMYEVYGLMGSSFAMSEFQAAVALSELEHLERRNRIRERSAAILDRELSAAMGLTPVLSAKSTTARTYFKYAVRRSPEAFAGVPTPLICEALTAELGFTVEQTECMPLHRGPLFEPWSKRRHRLPADYLDRLDQRGQRFPEAERHFEESITFHHRVLLTGEEDLMDIVRAFEKVQREAPALAAG